MARTDDAGRPRTVPDDEIAPGPLAIATVALSPRFNITRWSVRVGANVGSLTLPVAVRGNWWTTRERNQSNTTQRGTGTSLVYYAITARHKPVADPFGEIEVRMRPLFSILWGYSYTSAEIQVQNGYDRYNALKTHSTHPLSRNRIHETYVGVRLGKPEPSFLVLAGPVFQKVVPTELGPIARCEFRRRGYMVGIGPAYRWDSRKAKYR